MFVLGLLILAAAVVFAIEFVIANDSGTITFKLWNQTWSMDAFWLGVMGAAFVLVVVVALLLMRGSMARGMRMRAERRELAAENERLAARAKHAAPPPTARKNYPAPPSGATPPPAAYPAAPPAPAAPAPGSVAAPTDDGRQVAYVGGAPAPAEAADGTRHHRFFSRHSDR